jgi:hypothetical protein
MEVRVAPRYFIRQQSALGNQLIYVTLLGAAHSIRYYFLSYFKIIG